MNFLKILTFFSILFSLISLRTTAMAKLLGDYIKPDNPKPIEQRSSLGSGSRSTNCQSKLNKGDIALMVPSSEEVHITTKAQPSLYLSSQTDEKIPFKFTLVEPSSSKVLVEKELELKELGVAKIDLPRDVALEEGKIYLWYVAFSCQNNPEEDYDVLGAGIERKALTQAIELKLSAAKNEREKAQIFATNGVWYEALEYAYLSEPTPESRKYINQLLRSAGIDTKNLNYVQAF